MPTRMYLVELKKKKVLVEAASQEAAVQKATKPMVKGVSIPTPLEVARLMRDGVEVISPSVTPPEPPAEKPQGEQGEGVGRMGLADGDDGGGSEGGGAPAEK